MDAIKQMAEMTGFKENDLAQWLELMAVEMSSGATFEQAQQNITNRLSLLYREMQKPESQQSDWFRAWKESMATDIYFEINRREAQRRIFA